MREDIFHIVWFAKINKKQINKDEKAKRLWIQMVLTRGMTKDIRKLNLKEVKKYLPQLNLPIEIKTLWQNFLKKY